MRANEFIKKFGVHIADHCLNDCASPDDRWFIHHGALIDGEDFDELKRLVGSHELVEKHGGLISARKYIKFLRSSVDIGLYHGLDDVDYKTEIPLIEQAIADVESCQ